MMEMAVPFAIKLETTDQQEPNMFWFEPTSTTFTLIPSDPDGNCLFSSLGHHLKMRPTQIREEVITFARSLPQSHLNEIFNKVPTGSTTVDCHLDTMSASGTWGGTFELILACQRYALDLFVLSPDNTMVRLRDIFNVLHIFICIYPTLLPRSDG